jgi:hypothetical protein
MARTLSVHLLWLEAWPAATAAIVKAAARLRTIRARCHSLSLAARIRVAGTAVGCIEHNNIINARACAPRTVHVRLRLVASEFALLVAGSAHDKLVARIVVRLPRLPLLRSHGKQLAARAQCHVITRTR